MATTRIMPLHVGKGRTESRAISDIIDYVANPKKTDNGRLITGYACDSRTADAEFLLAKRQYIAATGRVRGADDVIAYHVRQSFRPGEITPEEANRLGMEFAKRFTKGNHAFVVCTHIDKSHIHNHIIWSSVSLEYDRKFRNFWGSTKAVRRLSDTICIENGLSIVENPKPHGKSYNTWLGDQAKPSRRELLRVTIDNALSQSPANFEELLKLLQESGCEVSKRGKSYRLKLPGWEKAAHLDSLGEGYGLEDLQAVLSGKKAHTPRKEVVAQAEPPKVNLLVDIQAKLQAGKGAGYARWAKVFNLKQMAQTMNYLSENNLLEYAVLEEKAAAATAHHNELSAQIKAAEKRMAEIAVLRTHIVNYAKTREVYVAYRKAGYSEIFNTFPEDRNGGGAYTADAIMKDTEMAKERVGELVRNIGGNPDDVNADNFVRVSTYMDFSDDSNMFVVLATIVFGILFMFCGYLLIYNVFEIAVTNDIRQYGLLRTVGTTSKQIKRLVNWQALYLFLIGTPVGLLVGLLVGRGVLPAAIEVFAFDYGASNIEVGSLPYLAIVIISILFSGITVFISTRKSVKKASCVSPIEAVRYVEHEHFSVKRKTSHNGSVIFRMATANTTRNKRRTVFIVVSLTLSIVLLNSVFIFTGSFDENVFIKSQTRSDFAIYNPDNGTGDGFMIHDSGLSAQIIADIEARSGITHEAKLYRNTYEDAHIACDWGVPYSVDNTNRYSYALPDNINLGVHQNGEMKEFTALTPDDLPLGNVFGFSESLLDKMDIVEGETNLEILKEKLRNENGVILVAIYDNRGEITGGADNSMYAGLSVGDTIQFYENGVPTEKCPIIAKTAITDTEVSVNVAGASMIADIGMPLIYMPEEHFKEIYKDPTLYALLFDVEEEYRQDMENYLSQKDDVGYISTGSLRTTISSIKNVVLLVGGMIGAIFALVGLINFINLVMTNIIARRHEFATMQSIGMTNQQLRKMVILESLFYVLRAGIVGVVASGFLGLTLVKVLVDAQYNMMTFQMTLLPALIMLVLFLVLAFIVPVIALRLFNNRSAVERLRVNE